MYHLQHVLRAFDSWCLSDLNHQHLLLISTYLKCVKSLTNFDKLDYACLITYVQFCSSSACLILSNFLSTPLNTRYLWTPKLQSLCLICLTLWMRLLFVLGQGNHTRWLATWTSRDFVFTVKNLVISLQNMRNTLRMNSGQRIMKVRL